MKQSIIYAIFLSVGVIIGASATLALKGGPRHHRPPDKFHRELPKEDREKIRALFKEGKGDVRETVEKMESVGEELRKKMKDPSVSKEELTKLFKSFHDLRQQLTDKRFEMNLKIRDAVGAEKMDGLDVLGPVPGPRGPKGPRGREDGPPRGHRPPPPEMMDQEER